MRTGYALLTALSLSLTALADCTPKYYLQDEWVGDEFYTGWNWETGNDPTNGRVNFVSQADAKSKNLTYVENGVFYMHGDDVSIVPASARGRDSIRINSDATYNDSIIVLDIAHMPSGCGTWPAFWTLSKTSPWPYGGEVDIIEGVNVDSQNHATLHTSPNCKMPPDTMRKPQIGATATTDCNAFVNSNSGCGVLFPETAKSYGASFNQNGGGWYVMYRGQDSIQIWFYGRDDQDVPDVIRNGADCEQSVFPDSTWGDPDAHFPFDKNYCDYDQHFNAHEIVFDLTFCGDWAGNSGVFGSSCGAKGSCSDFVNNHPSEFKEAYWAINSLRVYTP